MTNIKCSYGCGHDAKFFNKKTNQGRCSELVGNCPAIKASKKAKHEARAKIREAELATVLANPQPCKCGAPGKVYSERNKTWRCHEKQGACPAVKAKREATCEVKYGTSVIAHIPGVQDARSESLKETHSKKTNEQKDATVAARTATCEERYGVKYYSQLESHKKALRAANLRNYGVEHTLQVKSFRAQGVINYKKKTGYDHWSLNPAVADKKAATLLKNYGVEFPYKSDAIYAKRAATMVERHGAEHSMHVPELAEKAITNASKKKSYVMPSGDIRTVQGYEPFALDTLLSLGFREDEIFTSMAEQPRLTYTLDGKVHRYYPDIFIPSRSHVIEVKSLWTLDGGPNGFGVRAKNVAKMISAVRAGYKFTCLVFDEKGELIEQMGDELV